MNEHKKNSFPHHTMFNQIMTCNVNPNVNPRMNMTAVRYPMANETIATCHVRHTCMPINQTINKIFM